MRRLKKRFLPLNIVKIRVRPPPIRKSTIKDLVKLSEEYNVPISVATGGTLARRIVVKKRPHIIIGVACERDLTSGIQDSFPIPVYGVLNKRPFGPCYDTDVDMDMVEKAVRVFLKNEKG